MALYIRRNKLTGFFSASVKAAQSLRKTSIRNHIDGSMQVNYCTSASLQRKLWPEKCCTYCLVRPLKYTKTGESSWSCEEASLLCPLTSGPCTEDFIGADCAAAGRFVYNDILNTVVYYPEWNVSCS